MSEPIEDAVRAATNGELIVMPTDTVYGIGTRPDDPAATSRLFRAKGRPRDLELPVLVPSSASAHEVAEFDELADALAVRFWAGPLTLVLPRTPASRGWDLGGDPSTIGVRMPHHPLALAVLARAGPLAVTSANRSGAPTPTTCEEVAGAFGDAVAVYLCEDASSRVASTVLDLAHGEPTVIRPGAVSERALRTALEDLGAWDRRQRGSR